MKGVYKTTKSIFLFEFIAYKNISWKKLLNHSGSLTPKIHFQKKGLLAIYNLEGCHLDGSLISRRGKEIELIKLSK